MNKKVQRISAMGIALVLAFSAGQLDYAHSGRTDSSGGHKDNKNKSGLGYYHYHHGYGPHLHTSGVCPYEVSTTSNTNMMVGTSKSEPVVTHVHGNLPSFKVSVCGSELDQSKSQYPLFVYNDITYLPMTWGMCHALGITSEYKSSTGLHLTTGQLRSDTFEPIQTEDQNTSDEVDIDDVDLIVWIDGAMLTEDSQYPFKNYNGVTYIPLTWDMAMKLGIQYNYSAEKGLVVE